MNEIVQTELKKIFNGRFSTSESTRANYARGEDTYDPILSKAVVFPETNEEVSQLLKLCNEHKIPVVPFGTGTSLEGHVVGNQNGITISLEKMNKVLSVNAEDFDCRVQANVTRKQLIYALMLRNENMMAFLYSQKFVYYKFHHLRS